MSFENWNKFVTETTQLIKQSKAAQTGESTGGKINMDEKAKEARRAYKRAWNRANRDRVKAAQERYWSRKAEKAAQESKEQQEE